LVALIAVTGNPNQHSGSLSFTMIVQETSTRGGVGIFAGTGGLNGNTQQQGNTEFNVGLSLDPFVGTDGKWQLDTMTLSTGFLTHTLSDVVTTRAWTATQTAPYLNFGGLDTT